MSANSTREKALAAALDLFSRKGYEATSMGDIAGALGIKAPSLYKHFKGKEDLYAALTPMLEEHYAALWTAAAQRQAQLEDDLATGVLSAEGLEQETLAWLRSELDDPTAAAYRRLMTLSQFDDPATQAPAQSMDRWLWTEPLALYEGLFARLVQREILRRGDPHVMAVEYLAPLFQLLSMADRAPQGQNPDQPDCLDEARRHIRQFHRVFAHREPRGGQNAVSRLFRR